VLRLDNLAKSFGGRALFEGASLDVRAEDRIGLVGRNGAGKTTLLRILARQDTPDSGRAQDSAVLASRLGRYQTSTHVPAANGDD
jgi:ATP-binding cassette subfamily F protein uup